MVKKKLNYNVPKEDATCEKTLKMLETF